MRRRARPILGVDIDNVLAQSDACLRAMFRELYGIMLDEHQMTRYDYMTYGVTEEQLVRVFQLFNTEVCRTLRVVPGAKTALVRLNLRKRVGASWAARSSAARTGKSAGASTPKRAARLCCLPTGPAVQ